MVLFQGKLISGWFNANTINAIAIISIIKPRILAIRFFMQSTSSSNWELSNSVRCFALWHFYTLLNHTCNICNGIGAVILEPF